MNLVWFSLIRWGFYRDDSVSVCPRRMGIGKFHLGLFPSFQFEVGQVRNYFLFVCCFFLSLSAVLTTLWYYSFIFPERFLDFFFEWLQLKNLKKFLIPWPKWLFIQSRDVELILFRILMVTPFFSILISFYWRIPLFELQNILSLRKRFIFCPIILWNQLQIIKLFQKFE